MVGLVNDGVLVDVYEVVLVDAFEEVFVVVCSCDWACEWWCFDESVWVYLCGRV